MTKTSPNILNKSPFFRRITSYLKFPLLVLTVAVLIKYSSVITTAILAGINLAVRSIIPSLFPFLILSDLLICTNDTKVGVFGRFFSRLFGLPASAGNAFLCGSFSGFPIGVKCAADLYSRTSISKQNLERLIGFVNNPSPAFVISAVGAMRSNTLEGVWLYTSVLLSAVITGIVFSKREKISPASKLASEENKFNLVSSIKNAAYTSISISAYIIFFSALLGVIDAIFSSAEITLLCSLFLEIGNAASLLAKSSLDKHVSLIMTSFALGFSGISVHMQARSLLPENISMKKYSAMKLFQGLISASVTLIIVQFI